MIYRLRTRLGATSLEGFLVSRYGRAAALAFSVAVLIRLYNEIWSNTAVVGGYFGAPGSTAYIGAAVAFTLVTLAYSIKGGLRGSIVTDVAQALIFVGLVLVLAVWVIPEHGAARLLASGDWRLDAGLDLLLVAALQLFSYPFHDPVLTDRGFLARVRAMLASFVLAGVLGFVAIAAFGLIGVHASLEGLVGDGNVPAVVAQSMGLGAFFVMSVVMMSSTGSTLDSTFTSLARSLGRDLPRLRGGSASVRVGVLVMVAFAVLGNLPMIAGTDILKATTISGTMVVGLAPVFLFHGTRRHPLNFHLSFWTGLALGLLHAAGQVPPWARIGEGDYADLLGVNAWGLALCTLLFWLPVGHRGRVQ
ncbi:sodium:solute symporter [Arhodomonas sp. SL1]|uniref:sodium:solute symporter n=1 Tax=Arhodomonas sp. SL1 TaxID=3425691 RepID=UPI003F8810FC